MPIMAQNGIKVEEVARWDYLPREGEHGREATRNVRNPKIGNAMHMGESGGRSAGRSAEMLITPGLVKRN